MINNNINLLIKVVIDYMSWYNTINKLTKIGNKMQEELLVFDPNQEVKKVRYIIHNVDQGSDEWFNIRIGRITASTIVNICATNAGRKTMAILKATEVITGKLPDHFSNIQTKRGNEFETKAKVKYEEVKNCIVDVIGFAELDEYVGASPDGLVGDEGIIEIKCPEAKKFLVEVISNKIDKKYIYQMQMQMWVLNRSWCDYVIYNEDFERSIHIIRVDRDEEIIKIIKDNIEIVKVMIRDNIQSYFQEINNTNNKRV